jgi:glycerophosphoryl diester phosphodiesterase
MRIYMTVILAVLGMEMVAQQVFIAHRGASYLAPENTVAAANLAWELGADAVEVDVFLTKDNRVMVIHDKDTKRTAAGRKNMVIKNTPSLVLRNLDVGSWKDEKYRGEKIPFLAEIIKTVPEGKTLVVEIKTGSEILPHLKRSVDKSGKKDQIIFISFGWDTILDTKKDFPENKCYWLSSSKSGLKNKMIEASKVGLEGVNLNYRIIDEEVMEMAKELNLEVLAWTVNDPEIAVKIIDLGVKAITTDRPKWLKEEIEKLQK